MPLSSSSLRTKKQAVWFVIIGVGILMAFCTWRLALWKEEAIRGMENKRHQDELQAIQSELQRKASELSSQLSAKQDEIDSQKRATGELKDQLGKLGSQLSDLKTERQKSDNPSSPPKAVVQMKKEESTVRNTIVTENAKTDFTNAAVPPPITGKWQAVRIGNATTNDIAFIGEDADGVRHNDISPGKTLKARSVRNSKFLLILDQSNHPGFQEKRYVLNSSEFDHHPTQAEVDTAPVTEIYVIGRDSDGYEIYAMRRIGR